MKSFFKLLILPAVLLAVGTIACNYAKQDNTTAETNAGNEDHVHTFACPMHPDMQGHEGEK